MLIDLLIDVALLHRLLGFFLDFLGLFFQAQNLVNQSLQILRTGIADEDLKISVILNILVDEIETFTNSIINFGVELDGDFAFVYKLLMDRLELLNGEFECLIFSLPDDY